MIAESSVLSPGQTAVLTLKSPVKSGKIFLSVEKDDAILDTQVLDITGYGQKIEIPIKQTYLPNIYVRAFLIGKDDPKGLPIFKMALTSLRITSGSQDLTVNIVPSKLRYLPGESMKVEVIVKDAVGKVIP